MAYKKITVGLFLLICKCFLIDDLDETGNSTGTKDSD